MSALPVGEMHQNTWNKISRTQREKYHLSRQLLARCTGQEAALFITRGVLRALVDGNYISTRDPICVFLGYFKRSLHPAQTSVEIQKIVMSGIIKHQNFCALQMLSDLMLRP
jgi:hypothetical protein